MCRVAKDPVEIALAGRDNFGTAVTLALMLLLRRAPLRHRFVPHCVTLHGGGESGRFRIRNNLNPHYAIAWEY
jgi:hypothetical protein